MRLEGEKFSDWPSNCTLRVCIRSADSSPRSAARPKSGAGDEAPYCGALSVNSYNPDPNPFLGEMSVNAIRRILSAFLMLVFGIFVANAQTSNGTVIGAVTDSTGGAVVGATITITSVDNGAVRTTTTSQDGTYRVESVLAGVYNISAAAAGFETT